MDDAVRRAKEEHVQGHEGTSVSELNLILSLTLLSYALWKSLNLVQDVPRVPKFLLEYGVLVLPLVVALMSEWATAVGTTLICLTAAVAILSLPPQKRHSSKAVDRPKENSPASLSSRHNLPFLTVVRGTLQLVTLICILAVDFRAFPRRFAKTEMFGTSLMDLGVGLFIYSGGIVAGPRLAIGTQGWKTIGKSLRQAIPVLVLGIGRMILTKSVNYQEHVTEYGLHWNFFITLGFLPLTTSILQLTFPFLTLNHLAILIAGVYTCCIEFLDLTEYVQHAPRTTLFSMNREGILSSIGYLAIFLFSADIGAKLRVISAQAKGSHAQILSRLIATLLVFSGAFLFSTRLLGWQVSRRMANLPYVLWICAASTFHVAGCAAVDMIFSQKLERNNHVPHLFQAINRNQLVVFLLGNVMTGLVNLMVDTLAKTDLIAVAIVSVYLLIISSIALLLDTKNITLKL
ncbi:GWT1-domain-containing protein [Phlyctochytrium arcticum]|nr:GWT1-domain-containing protein [Phlyctochytrium arcticum]